MQKHSVIVIGGKDGSLCGKLGMTISEIKFWDSPDEPVRVLMAEDFHEVLLTRKDIAFKQVPKDESGPKKGRKT